MPSRSAITSPPLRAGAMQPGSRSCGAAMVQLSNVPMNTLLRLIRPVRWAPPRWSSSSRRRFPLGAHVSTQRLTWCPFMNARPKGGLNATLQCGAVQVDGLGHGQVSCRHCAPCDRQSADQKKPARTEVLAGSTSKKVSLFILQPPHALFVHAFTHGCRSHMAASAVTPQRL